MNEAGGIEVSRVRVGRSPNCSAAGSVVGAALLTLVAVAGVLSAFADRVSRWRGDGSSGGPTGGEGLPPTGLGGGAGPTPESGSAGARIDPRAELRVRPEGDHAILAWPEPPALLWVDRATGEAATRAGARALPAGGPLEAHVSLGERCPVQCTACYTDAGPSGGVADRARLRADLASLASLGVFEIALGGGEPLSHPDLGEVLDAVAAEGMVPNLTTSGVGLTPALAARIAARAGQVNVSLDGDGEDYAAVRGWRGADVAWRAIAMLRAAGVPVGVNTVLTRQTFDALPALGARLAAAGVVEWQWLRLKPTGRGADRYAALALTAAQRRALWGRLLEVEAATGLRMRVDCAMVPFLAAGSPPPEALARLGVLGCPGGTDLMAVDGAGVVRPCSFVQGPAPAGEGSVAARWEADPTLRAWRDRGAAPPEPCASCPYQASCRGGCRVVAGHVTGDGLAPDPECERVAAWAEAGWSAGT